MTRLRSVGKNSLNNIDKFIILLAFQVVVKLNQLGEGPPGREQVITEDQRRQMMAAQYRRQEELKVRHSRVSNTLLSLYKYALLYDI